jgi:RHS repeat-associated protein
VTCTAPSFSGSFASPSCTQLAGWAWDATEPNDPINVDIYDGTTLIATVLANTFHQDLLNAGIGNGAHGFFLLTPAALKTGTAHTITLKAGGTPTVIGTPQTLTCSSANFAGFFDYADCTQLAGWAWDANQPIAALNVDIYDNGALLATIPAATFRQDLQNAGKGNGDHGFTYSTPALYSDTTHSLSVTYSGTTIPLGGTPKTITCPTEPILARFFPGGMQSAGTNYYFSYDHLGSVREVTDPNGNVTSRYDYDPYGRLTVNQGVPPRFGFAGTYYHQTSGLDLTQYRAYDPDLGRWESRDLLFGMPSYRYSENDPINSIDTDGRVAIALPAVALVALTFGVIAYEEWLSTPGGKQWLQNIPRFPLPNIAPPAIPLPPDLDPHALPFPLHSLPPPLPIPLGPRDRAGAPGRGCPPPTAIPGQRPRVTPPRALRPADSEDNRAPDIEKEVGGIWGEVLKNLADILDWFN